MKSSSTGLVSPALVAVVSAVAIVASAFVISNSDNFLTLFSSAAPRRSNVRLVKDTVQFNFLKNPSPVGGENKKKLLLTGDFCFASHLRTGSEIYTIWASYDSGGRDFVRARGESTPVSSGPTLNTGGSYPAPCVGFDTESGEAELQNKGALQPHSFALQLSFENELSAANCPGDVYLNYESNRQGGRGFAKVNLADIGACGGGNTTPPPLAATATTFPPPVRIPNTPVVTFIPGTTTTPTSSRTPTPTIGFIPVTPSNPTATPRLTTTPGPINNNIVEGRVTVFSCVKPDYVQVNRCQTIDGVERCSGLPYNRTDEKKIQTDGVWLDDNNADNTWTYRYRISSDLNGRALTRGNTIKFDPKGNPAIAFIGGVARRAERDEVSRLTVIVPGTRDFKIMADETCGCSFHAVTQIKDEAGNPLNLFDGRPGLYGASNEKRITQIGDGPDPNFPFAHNGKPGEIEVFYGNIFNPLDDYGYGRDALTSVRAYIAQNYEVVEQRCETMDNSKVPACPNYSINWTKTTFEPNYDPFMISGLRLTCGADLTYGWKVRQKATPPPGIGNGDMEVRVTALNWPEVTEQLPASHIGSQEPKSCERLQTPENPNAQERPLYISAAEVIATCTNCSDKPEFEKDLRKGDGHMTFENLPAGEYSLRIKFGDDAGFDIWPGCTNKTWTVESGGTVAKNAHTRAVIILQNRAGEEYKHEGTEQVCKEGQGVPSRLLGVRDVYCYYPNGEQDRSGFGSGTGPGGCWPPNELKCSGDYSSQFTPDQGDQMCASEGLGSWVGWCATGTNSCCQVETSSGGGGTGPNPTSSPVDPGVGGGGSGGSITCTGDYDQDACFDTCNINGNAGNYCEGPNSNNRYQCCQLTGAGSPNQPIPTQSPGEAAQYILSTSSTKVIDAKFTNRNTNQDAGSASSLINFSGGGRLIIYRSNVSQKTEYSVDLLRADGSVCVRKNFSLQPGKVNNRIEVSSCNDSTNPTPGARPTATPGIPLPTLPSGDRIDLEINMFRDQNEPGSLEVKTSICARGAPGGQNPRETVCGPKTQFLFESGEGNYKLIKYYYENATSNILYTLKCEAKWRIPFSLDINKICDPFATVAGTNVSLVVSANRNTEGNRQLFAQFNNKTQSNADIDGNGVVNTLDYLMVIDNYGAEAAGLQSIEQSADINGDGIINAVDASIIINFFGEETK